MNYKYNKENIVNDLVSKFPEIKGLFENDYFDSPFSLSGVFVRDFLFKLDKKSDLPKIELFFKCMNDYVEFGDDFVKSLVFTGFFEEVSQEEEMLDLAKKYLSTEGKEAMNDSLKFTGARRVL